MVGCEITWVLRKKLFSHSDVSIEELRYVLSDGKRGAVSPAAGALLDLSKQVDLVGVEIVPPINLARIKDTVFQSDLSDDQRFGRFIAYVAYIREVGQVYGEDAVLELEFSTFANLCDDIFIRLMIHCN